MLPNTLWNLKIKRDRLGIDTIIINFDASFIRDFISKEISAEDKEEIFKSRLKQEILKRTETWREINKATFISVEPFIALNLDIVKDKVKKAA